MQSAETKKKVLVIDDEPSICDVLERYFKKRGFEVKKTGSAKEAMEVFLHFPADIVLLDLIMPDTNGIDTLIELRKMRPSVKIIVISGVKSEEIFHRCMDLGALDYIVKPFDLFSLDARVSGKLLW